MPISTLYIAPLIFTLLTDFLSTVKRTGQTTNKTINNKEEDYTMNRNISSVSWGYTKIGIFNKVKKRMAVIL